MRSLSIDYLFNRVYDVLLWIKYVWLFDIMRDDPQEYLDAQQGTNWDGLRDRGWFDEYFKNKNSVVPSSDTQLTLWQRMLESFGFKLRDSDGDGVPDVSDPSPYDANNLTAVQLKERYQLDYNFSDKVRNIFGIGPKDSDGDGVPNSYENAHGLNPNDPDTDHDGVLDGREIVEGTDPHDPDTDHDMIIDGRDEAPLDPHTSSIGIDTDGDGVSDKIEHLIGTDINVRDTDGDGMLDGMDTYPLDLNNVSQLQVFDVSKHTEGLHLSIQNPVLSLLADFLSVLAVFILVVFVYVSVRWFIFFLKSLDTYDEHFEYKEIYANDSHIVKTPKEEKDEFMPAGIVGLPVSEEVPAAPPTMQDFEDHPRFAIVQGYMNSNHEALWRIGILEADNMLADVLREKGYQGEGVGEMLQNANFKTVDLAWDAHKLRNRIAHTGSDFVLTEREAKRAFILYEYVFKELKVVH